MVATITGVATHINETESHDHLTHCHGYTLQLAVGYTIEAIKIMTATLDVAFLLDKLIKYSMV